MHGTNFVAAFQSGDRLLEKVFEVAVHWLGIGGNVSLVPIFEAVEKVFLFMSSDSIANLSNEIVSFLQQSRRSVFELRKSDAFWSAFRGFVAVVVNGPLLAEKRLEGDILQIMDDIFEESNLVHGMSFAVVDRVTSLQTSYQGPML